MIFIVPVAQCKMNKTCNTGAKGLSVPVARCKIKTCNTSAKRLSLHLGFKVSVNRKHVSVFADANYGT